MKVAVIADVHGKFTILQKIMDEVVEEKPDVIIAPGDFTDMFDVPTNFTQMDVADIVIQKLLIPGKPLLCIPGNHDPYEIIDVFEEYGVNLQRKKIKNGGFCFLGCGGARTPFNTIFEPTDEEIWELLSRHETDSSLILVTHAPPKGTTLDLVGGKKHVGSPAVRKFIEERKPILAISAHIHECSGTDRIGVTTVFYPGPAFKGYYGIVSLDGKRADCVVKRVIL